MQLNLTISKWIGLGLICISTIAILIWVIQVFGSINTLKVNLSYLSEMAKSENPLLIPSDDINALITSSREEVVFLKRNASFFIDIAPYFSWLPRIGDILGELPDIMHFADLGTLTINLVWNNLESVYIEMQSQGININMMYGR